MKCKIPEGSQWVDYALAYNSRSKIWYGVILQNGIEFVVGVNTNPSISCSILNWTLPTGPGRLELWYNEYFNPNWVIAHRNGVIYQIDINSGKISQLLDFGCRSQRHITIDFENQRIFGISDCNITLRVLNFNGSVQASVVNTQLANVVGIQVSPGTWPISPPSPNPPKSPKYT